MKLHNNKLDWVIVLLHGRSCVVVLATRTLSETLDTCLPGVSEKFSMVGSVVYDSNERRNSTNIQCLE